MTKKEIDKYKETKYRHKGVDTSAVNITIGTQIYSGNKLYGTVIRESELFYYLDSEDLRIRDEAAGREYEPIEFMKNSLKEKIVQGKLSYKEVV